MRRALFPVVIALWLGVLPWLSAGCGRSAPPAPSPAPGGVETITGQERIGWDQPAEDAGELATFRYAIYADGVRTEIADASCGSSAGPAGFACTGRLPALSPGAHNLEIATFLSGGDAESARSAPLRVTVAALTADTTPVAWEGGQIETAGDGRLRLDRLAGDLDAPIDAAFIPDGRLLIVERSGRVRVIAGAGEVQAADALSVDAADGRVSDPVASIAIDPDFLRTRFVFAVQALVSADSAVFSVARFRELGGILAQRAVIFETRIASPVHPGAVIRFGPDGKLYVALGNGSLLRLNPDGSMPRDQAGTTPAIAAGIQSPRGLAWHPGSGILWIVDQDVAGESGAGAGHLSGVVVGGDPLRAAVRARHNLLEGAMSIAFLGPDALIASPRGRYILRLRFSADDPKRIAGTERWLEGRVGAVRVVLTGPDGAIYFCTDDALGRLTPAP